MGAGRCCNCNREAIVGTKLCKRCANDLIYRLNAVSQKELQEACDNARREGYEEGYRRGQRDADARAKNDGESTYERALVGAWRTVQQVIQNENRIRDIFGTEDIFDVLSLYAPVEIMRRIEEYERRE